MNETPEVLIVGSGPVGATFARVIHDVRPGTEILMVDAGPQLTATPGVHVRNIRDPSERLLAQVRSQAPTVTDADLERAASLTGRPPSGEFARPGTAYVDPEAMASGAEETLAAAAISTDVGGMGVHWTCACPSPFGRELPDFIGEAEWRSALTRAQELLAVTQDVYPPTAEWLTTRRVLCDLFDERLPEGRRVQSMPLACIPRDDGSIYWTGPDVILGRLATAPPASFTLRPRTLCRRLTVADGRVVEALLVDLATGHDLRVRPQVVVVACDALRTPQLLWNSGIRPEALGRYLNDHIQVMSAVSLEPELIDRLVTNPSERSRPQPRRTEGDPTMGIHWIPFSDEHPYSGVVMQLDLSPIALGVEDGPGSQVVGIGHFVPKEIRAEDRIVFSDAEFDAYGMPKMRFEYRLTAADHRAIADVKALQTRMAAAFGGFRPGFEPKRLPNGSSLHYQGSVRMGSSDDGTSVCDPQCRVWGLENCFVGGNGVIPTPTAGNITLSSVAHAVRSAQVAVAALR